MFLFVSFLVTSSQKKPFVCKLTLGVDLITEPRMSSSSIQWLLTAVDVCWLCSPGASVSRGRIESDRKRAQVTQGEVGEKTRKSHKRAEEREKHTEVSVCFGLTGRIFTLMIVTVVFLSAELTLGAPI